MLYFKRVKVWADLISSFPDSFKVYVEVKTKILAKKMYIPFQGLLNYSKCIKNFHSVLRLKLKNKKSTCMKFCKYDITRNTCPITNITKTIPLVSLSYRI